MRADVGEGLMARRIELRTANTELLRLDLRISRLEMVLKLLLADSASADQTPTIRRVEPHRAPC